MHIRGYISINHLVIKHGNEQSSFLIGTNVNPPIQWAMVSLSVQGVEVFDRGTKHILTNTWISSYPFVKCRSGYSPVNKRII